MQFSSDFLRTFINVAEERSFSLAAKKLHKSQSSVSTQITVLEDQCGTKLFDRSPRPLRLTQAGVLFLNFAKEVTHRAQQLTTSLIELNEGTTADIKIGAITSIATYLLPPIVRAILNNFKFLKVTVSAQTGSQLYESIRKNEIDFAIVLSDQEARGLSTQVLRTESFSFVVAPDHLIAHKRQISLKGLQNIPFVVGQESSSYTEMLNRMLKRKGVSEYQVAARISTLEGMKELTRTGIGIAILPQYIVERDIRSKSLIPIQVKGCELSAKMYLVENAHSEQAPTVVAVRNLIIDSVTRWVSSD